MRDPVKRLRGIAEIIGDGAERAWLFAVVERMEAGATWSTACAAQARAERDRLLIWLRESHYGSQRLRPAAEAMASDLARYEALAWPRTRFAADCPHRNGTLDAALWAVLATGGRSIGASQMIAIIDSEIQSTPLETGQNAGEDLTVEM